MIKTILLILIFISTLCLAQVKKLDMIELKNGRIMVGNIGKIENDFIEFKEYNNGIIYKFKKNEIRYIEYGNGETLNLEEYNPTDNKEQKRSQQKEILSEQHFENNKSMKIIVSIDAGYGFTNMNMVNQNLKYTREVFSGAGGITTSPEKAIGGLYLEGNFILNFGNLNLGVTGDYISSSGIFTYKDMLVSFYENYFQNTKELLGLLEIQFSIENSIIVPFIHLAGGLGFANAERLSDLEYYGESTYTYTMKNTVNGKYFVGKIKGGFKIILGTIMLQVSAGYRIANAGELKGDYIENGTLNKNMPIIDTYGNAIKFDYSGFLFMCGISIIL